MYLHSLKKTTKKTKYVCSCRAQNSWANDLITFGWNEA